jgi:TolB-like protein
MTAAPDIFLSYNREDQARAKLFAEAFEGQGFKVWWDVGLRTGEAYDEVTETALRTAKAVVVLWSKKSVQSRWVRAEATLADRNKTLVPCMIEPCERPIMFELTQTAELGHWDGSAKDKAWVSFLSDVQRLVAREAVPVAAAPTIPLAAPTVEETLKAGQSGSAPSLAVLPFTNRSGLSEDEVFAEGMVEDVISALSQGVNVRVLGAMATAHLRKGAITDLSAVGRQLGVRYLLEGNVRRVGANLRVTTQLLEAATGAVMWTAKFDRPLAELAELQEELVTEIAACLDTQVYAVEMERALKKPSDITAWEAVTRSMAAYRTMEHAAVLQGIEEAKRAITIAPDYGPAHAALATSLAAIHILSGSHDPAEMQRIRAVAERALVLAPEDSQVLGWAGNVLGLLGFPDEGVLYTRRAVRKSPGDGLAHHLHGSVCLMSNRPDEALTHFDTAARLMPGSHWVWLIQFWRTLALGELGRWEAADAAIDACLSLNPTFGGGYVTKAYVCTRLGRDAETLGHMEALQRPGVVLTGWERVYRCFLLRSPNVEAAVTSMRVLIAAAEKGA